jgi:NAD(P)-dependent dehydrogenase (short-subunit alcohol dehydrogenase family)
MDLAAARVLVTGGARRLGAEIAVDLAAHGASVAIAWRSHPDDAAATIARIERHGATAASVRADLADPDQARAAVAEAARGLGGLDAVIHAAAGGFRPVPFAEVTPALFEEAIGATLRGGFFVAQAAAEVLSDGGAIIFIGDVAGIVGWPAFLPHSAAKGALRTLTRGLARALAPRIRVAIIHPGTVLPAPDAADTAAASVPLRRSGQPSDITDAVRYLLGAAFVTGAELVVDGGRLIR